MTPVKPIRDGFHTVTPYLLVEGAPRLIEFLVRAFDAQVRALEARPGGSIMHAEVRIGDSMLMLGEASGEYRRYSSGQPDRVSYPPAVG